MANINNATVKVQGIDPTANAINSRIVAPTDVGAEQKITATSNSEGVALNVNDPNSQGYLQHIRDTNDNIDTNTTIISNELNIFQSTTQRGTNFQGYQTTGANPAACLSSLMTYLNGTNPDAKLHSYQITPANAAYTNFYITAVLIL